MASCYVNHALAQKVESGFAKSKGKKWQKARMKQVGKNDKKEYMRAAGLCIGIEG